jgi:hypothetical protein
MNDLTPPFNPERNFSLPPSEPTPHHPADSPLTRPIREETGTKTNGNATAEFVRKHPRGVAASLPPVAAEADSSPADNTEAGPLGVSRATAVRGLGRSATSSEAEPLDSGHGTPRASEPIDEESLHDHIGPDEPAFEEEAPADELAANEAEPDTEPPTDSTVDSKVPPTDRPPEDLTSPEQPDRGSELAKVINYAQNFRAEARKALEATVRLLPGGDGVIASLSKHGATLEEAVYAMPADKDGMQTTVGALYYGKEQEFARLQYSEALAATGLELQEDNHYVARVLMTNPESFAAALRTVTPPEEPEQKAGFASQIGKIVEESLTTASIVIVDQHLEEARAMCGEYKYHVQGNVYQRHMSTEQIVVGSTLPQQADSIARQLPRLQVSDDIVSQIRALAIAKREGLVTEWGVARGLDILEKRGERISADPTKIGRNFFWNVAYEFLGHLRDTAPDAQFTHEVRRTILDDLDTAAGTQFDKAAREARKRVLGILPQA